MFNGRFWLLFLDGEPGYEVLENYQSWCQAQGTRYNIDDNEPLYTKKYENCPFPGPQTRYHSEHQTQSENTANYNPSMRSSLHIRRRERLDNTSTVHEPRPENPVRVREHAILQTDHDELTAAEARADQSADVLRVGKVEGGVDFVENVHGCWGVLEEGEDEGEGDEGTGEVLVCVLRCSNWRGWESYR